MFLNRSITCTKGRTSGLKPTLVDHSASDDKSASGEVVDKLYVATSSSPLTQVQHQLLAVQEDLRRGTSMLLLKAW